MRVRTKITLVFALLVSAILSLVCISVYYFSSLNRVRDIRTRLTNRAITTARLMSQTVFFNKELLRKIDSATALAMTDKTIQVYDYLNNRIYWYSDQPSDTISVQQKVIDDARVENNLYFRIGRKDMIAHHYVDSESRVVIVAAAYDEDGWNDLASLKFILWLSLVGGVIVSVVAGYVFSGRLLSPIRKITKEINEISATNLARRIETGRVRDEWHELAKTLDQLLNRLQESFELQGRFISNASHELSTPLTVISSQLEVALQRERDVNEYRNILLSVSQDVSHLNRLTKTLLEFAKASGKAEGLNIEWVRIDEVLLEVAGQVKKLNAAYSVRLVFEKPPKEEENLIVAGNYELLLSAIKNVISNACKFSADHRAEVILHVRDNEIRIEVRDNGKGIPPDELQHIFQPFYRGESSRAEQGFGLGLSLANRIIKLHKGEVSAVSRVGEGSVFTIILPKAVF